MARHPSPLIAVLWLVSSSLCPGAVAQERPGKPAAAKVVLRAVRTSTAIDIDGRLDEEAYKTVAPTGGFIQQEPNEGAPATEATDVWVFFDDKNLYVSARCWDSHPEREVFTDLRRDTANMTQSDNIVVVLDTFDDKRNGFYFQTTPAGAIRDQAVIEEKSNGDWNTVWEVKASQFDKGYLVEMAIPFKSLRYNGSGPQTWGINFRRTVKWKNEMTYLTPMPAAYGSPGILKMAQHARLEGLETPTQTINLEVKPYAVTSVTTDRTAAVPLSNAGKASAGFDFKYGLTRSLIADATVNTDFAQIEEDVQQVNLTRFNLFFPEKRDFFLEGQGIFLFGEPPLTQGVLTPGDVPVMFFSRRIGLSQGQSIPVRAGGRLTGKAGRASIGALNIETGDTPEAGAPATNFTVARFKWDVLRRSNVGLLTTRRSPAANGGRANGMIGADTSLLFFKSVNIHGYWARSVSRGVSTEDSSYRGMFEYAGDRYAFIGEHLNVGRLFNPEVGYVQRPDMARSSVMGRFSPRPTRSVVRKYTFQGNLDYITNAGHDTLQNRTPKGTFLADFQNSDQLSVTYQRDFERLPRNFAIAPRVTVPRGSYDYQTTRVQYTLGLQRWFSGKVGVAAGSFYGGTKREASYSGRLAPFARLAVEPGVSLNWVRLPVGDFNVTQLTTRVIVSPSPRMLISSLMQFNAGTHSLNSSVRLHWEYKSGSDLFVVYSDGRDTAGRGFPDTLNHALAVKLTRLLRF